MNRNNKLLIAILSVVIFCTVCVEEKVNVKSGITSENMEKEENGRDEKSMFSDDKIAELKPKHGIYMEGSIPSIDKQEEFIDKSIKYDIFDTFIEDKNAIYGITENQEAVLLNLYSRFDKYSPPEELIIPSEVQGYPVTVIKGYACMANRIDVVRLPTSLKVLEKNALFSCGEVADISIPESVESIEAHSFDTFSPWYQKQIEQCEKSFFIINNTLIYCNSTEESLLIPDGVEIIAQGALEKCTAKEIILPESIKEIYSIPMTLCKMTIPDSVLWIRLSEANRETSWFQEKIQRAQDGMVIINGILLYCGQGEEKIEVSDNVWGISDAFRGNQGLREITLPKTVRVIGAGSFERCEQLSEIYLGEQVSYIGERAFWGCISLENIKIPNSLAVISEGCFYNCSKLESITIPDSVSGIRRDAFRKCTALTTLHLQEGLKYIEEGAFEECELLGAVRVPNSVEIIEYYAFWKCRNLSYIKLGEGIQFMESNVFGYPTEGSSFENGIYEKEKLPKIRKVVVIELPKKIPIEKVRFDETYFFDMNIQKGKDVSIWTKGWMKEMFGIHMRSNIEFIVHKDSAFAGMIQKHQIQDGKEMYRYRYYE